MSGEEERERRDFNVVGNRTGGVDEEAKASGEVIYADDYDRPGLLHGKIFRSNKPSAKIKSIDTSDAEKLNGVVTVITAEDVPHNRSVTNVVGQSADVGLLQAKQQVLAEDKVRFYGEPIALVAAEDIDTAEKALGLINIEYEDFPGIFDPEEAMKEDAPKIHGDTNVISRWKLREGNIKEGFEKADVIVENTYESPFQEHAHIEPESGVGWIDEDGVLNLRVATQVVEQYREIAHILGIPESKVRIRGTKMGGAFGGKEDLTVEPYIALLVWNTKKPVKLTYDREEMMHGRHKRPPYKMEYKHGATSDGKLVALEAKIVQDSGAYVYLSPWMLLYATFLSTGPYKIPNVKVDSYAVLTNNTYTSAFRCFGGAEVAIAYESQMDEIADELGADPEKIREKNYLKKGERTATGQEIESSVKLNETQARALEKLEDLSSEKKEKGKKIGRGFASCWQPYGRMTFLHDTASAWVGMEQDGTAIVRCGIPDLGGGQRESLRQITSELTGAPLHNIEVISTDTHVTPKAGTVTATRALYMSGNAVKKASKKIRKDILKKASEMLKVPEERLELSEGKVSTRGEMEKKVELSDVVKACNAEGNPLETLETFKSTFAEPITKETLKGSIFPDFTFGTQAAEVEVDTHTGEINVRKLVSAYDVGYAINPMRVEGQMEGGAVQGIGYATTENFKIKKGVPQTKDLATYTIPTSIDAPEIETIILQSKSGKGPFGAKGIGEPSMTATAPAVINAIANAINKRVKKLPATPEKILNLLTEKDETD